VQVERCSKIVNQLELPTDSGTAGSLTWFHRRHRLQNRVTTFITKLVPDSDNHGNSSIDT